MKKNILEKQVRGFLEEMIEEFENEAAKKKQKKLETLLAEKEKGPQPVGIQSQQNQKSSPGTPRNTKTKQENENTSKNGEQQSLLTKRGSEQSSLPFEIQETLKSIPI